MEVTFEGNKDVLNVSWADGHHGIYPWAQLRGACPCAVCKGRHGPVEISTVKRMEGVELIDYRPVGAYAFRFMFSDGHDTGIYSFKYLRRLCCCEECSKQRSGS
jgi:prepilin-type processing-associated H-X9-DG protein